MKKFYKMSLMCLGVGFLGSFGYKHGVLPYLTKTTEVDTVKVFSIEQERMRFRSIVKDNVLKIVKTSGNYVETETHKEIIYKEITLKYIPKCAADSVVFPQVGDKVVLQQDEYCLWGVLPYHNEKKIVNNISRQKNR